LKPIRSNLTLLKQTGHVLLRDCCGIRRSGGRS
jgi:hypothetical protein